MQLLAQRGIIIVDMSCCAGIGKHDHKKAFSNFFGYMRSKKPDALDWPYNPKTMHPDQKSDRAKVVQMIREEWRTQRQAYPGWLILPYGNRENLWIFTEPWITYLPNTENSHAGLDILYTFELIWRLERCLLPVFSDIAHFCEKLLAKYGPSYTENLGVNRLNDIRQAWLVIALAMLRFYREEGKLVKWRELENQLKTLLDHLSAEQKEFLNYEGFLFSLFSLDLPNVRQRLDNWRPNESQPYWMAKRAGALAEIGQLNETTDEMIQFSLVESRKKSKNDTSSPSYLTVSNEAYQMLLLRYVKDATNWISDNSATHEEENLIKEDLRNEWNKPESGQVTDNLIKSQKAFSSFEEDWHDLHDRKSDERRLEWDHRLGIIRNNQRMNELKQQNARWDELKAFRCDPWNELKFFELTLGKPPVERENITEKREFDIGRVTRTHHFISNDQEGLNAYSFLRFCEEVGLPFRVGNYTLATKAAVASLQRISRYSSFWATATLARLGDTKAVDNLFSRESVYSFTAREADQLIQSYLDALNQCRSDICAGDAFRNNNYGLRLAQLLPEVISRLCCKCSIEMKHRILEFITELYASPDKRNYSNIQNLTDRLISSMSEAEQYSLVPALLKIPFPENMNLIVKDEFLNPFLLLDLNLRPECSVENLEIQPGSIGNLFEQTVLDDVNRRRWAISSLVTLHKLQLLDVNQIKKLAEVIWHRTDRYNLPNYTDYYKFAFLSLPHPDDIDPSYLFKAYVKASLESGLNVGNSMSRGSIPLVHEILGAASSNGVNIWTTEDAVEILHRLVKWWNSDKDNLREKESVPAGPFTSKPEEFRSRLARIVELLAKVVGPKLGADSSDDIKNSLDQLLKEIRAYGLPALEAEAACLHLYPEQKADVYDRINEALISNQDSIEKDGLRAVAKIILGDSDAEANAAGPEPILMLSQYLTWCPKHSITPALWIVVRILRTTSINFPSKLVVATQKRLDRIFTETAYDNSNQDITFDEKLEIRRVSAILAATLWRYCKSCSSFDPCIVNKWRETCLSPDEFSEIRNAWINNEGAYL
ncbi:MAG: hypothetical protein PHI97_28970 [Desulfobulbus sp.]|nr:hypothetical protein [Desulfobulbus sp.]